MTASIVKDRTALKALDTTQVTSCYLAEKDREGAFLWQAGDYTTALASDGFEGVYVKADAVAISAGCWVRDVADKRFQIDWFGAKTAPDIKPIWDKVKLMAAGGAVLFGAATYTTSDTLAYEGYNNNGLEIAGVSETQTIIVNQGSGFTVQYYGAPGGGNEARGGGVFKMALKKGGTGTCSGVDIANVYRGAIRHIDTIGCGNTGIRITGRGAGDLDATFGFVIEQNRCRNGLIGIQIRSIASGGLCGSQIDIVNNNCDGNSTCGIWLASFDQVLVRSNTLTVCGHGTLSRGSVFVENFGITSRNLILEQNEIGNFIAGANFAVIVDSIRTLRAQQNRFIRNNGEVGSGAYLFGFTPEAGVLTDIKLENDYLVVQENTPPYVYVSFYGSNKSMNGPVQVWDPAVTLFDENYHSFFVSTEGDKVILFESGKDRRASAAQIVSTGSGTVSISSNNSLAQRVNINGSGGTAINVAGTKREGDILVLTVANNSGVPTTIAPSGGFAGVNVPGGTGLVHMATFQYATSVGKWVQGSDWIAV